jgi:hypothetical protein
MVSGPGELGCWSHVASLEGRMSSRSDHVRVLLAVGVLLARGLLTREDDPEQAAIRVNGRGYRYLSRFWTETGVLQADGGRWHIHVEDDRAASAARNRVAAQWITAGAPTAWALQEAEAAVMLLRVRPETAPRA